MLDKDTILEKIETEHVLTFMAELGEYPHSINKEKGEIWFKTICHGGDSHKLCYFESSKTFYCYTNCGFLSIFDFLKTAMNIDFYATLVLIAEKIGINNRVGFNSNISNKYTNEIREINTYIEMRKQKKHINMLLPSIEPKILDYFENNVFYQGWIDEGISIETMFKHNIRWFETEKAIIIPHLDFNGNIVGIRRRSLLEENIKNKYMPLILGSGNDKMTYSHSLNFNLYGLYENIQAIQNIKKIFITEGEKSVLLSSDFYGDNNFTVATCGFNISKWHRDMILSLGVEEVIIGFDKDFDPNIETDETHRDYKKFKHYLNRTISLANKFTPYCRTYVIWDTFDKLEIKDSPFDKGKETLEFLMENKIEMTTELLEGEYDGTIKLGSNT